MAGMADKITHLSHASHPGAARGHVVREDAVASQALHPGTARGHAVSGEPVLPQALHPGTARGHAMSAKKTAAMRWADMESDDDEPILPTKVSLASAVAPPFRPNRLIIVNLDNNTRDMIMFNINHTISWLREQLFQKFSIPCCAQKLTFYTAELMNNNEKTLHQCNIVDNATLHLADKRSLWIRILVPNGPEVALTVPPSLSVAVLKERVAFLTRTRASSLWLTFDTWLLQSSRVLSDYNIGNEATVQMHPRANKGGGNGYPWMTPAFGELWETWGELDGDHAMLPDLYLDHVGGEAQPVSDSQATTIPWGPRTPSTSEDSGTEEEEAGEQDAKRLRTTENTYRFSILVKPLLRDPLTVWVQPYTQVMEVKDHLFEKTEVPPRNQKLIFLGRQLADEETMSMCGVFEGCVIFLVLSLQGGGPAKWVEPPRTRYHHTKDLEDYFNSKTDPEDRPLHNNYSTVEFEDRDPKASGSSDPPPAPQGNNAIQEQGRKGDKESDDSVGNFDKDFVVHLCMSLHPDKTCRKIPMRVDGATTIQEVKDYWGVMAGMHNIKHVVYKFRTCPSTSTLASNKVGSGEKLYIVLDLHGGGYSSMDNPEMSLGDMIDQEEQVYSTTARGSSDPMPPLPLSPPADVHPGAARGHEAAGGASHLGTAHGHDPLVPASLHPGAARGHNAGGVGPEAPGIAANIAVVPTIGPSSTVAPSVPGVLVDPTHCHPQYSATYISDNTLLTSTHGRIVRASEAAVVSWNANPMPNALTIFTANNRTEKSSSTTPFIRRRQVFAFQFQNGSGVQLLFKHLSNLCDIVGVGRAVRPGHDDCFSALIRRTSYAKIDDEAYGVVESMAPVVKGHRSKHVDETSYEFIESWSKMQTETISNFVLISSNAVNADTVMEEWCGREAFYIHADINDCIAVPKDLRSARQNYVATHHTRLEQMWRALSNKPRKRQFVEIDSDTIPDIRTLQVPPSAMMCKYVDLADNTIKEFSVKDWLRVWHQTKTLVIFGDAGLGKTPVAMGIAACVAQMGEKRYFHKVSQVEQLPRGDMATGVPVLLDEFSPNRPRGHNPAHTLEELKIIFGAEHGGGITGKGSNGRSTGVIEFAPGQPRIVTTNAVDPNDFVKALPPNLFSLGAVGIAMVPPDGRAILKRLCWHHVQSNLFPAGVVNNFRMAARSSADDRFARIFSGAAALP